MADTDANPAPESDPIASIPPSSSSPPSPPADDAAAAIETHFADLALADELPASGWGDDDGPAVLEIAGGDEVTGDKVPVPAPRETAVSDSGPRFPRRPAEPDCTYYIKFGTCRFGMKCKFNHPARRKKNRAKGSGSSGSSNKASSPPDDDQTPKEEYEEDLVPDIAAEVDSLGFVNKGSKSSNSGDLMKTSYEKGQMEPKELKIAEETEKGTYLKKFDETDDQKTLKVAKEKRRDTVSEGSAQEECKYYKMFGGCKFGKSCRYLHPGGKERKTEVEKVELNFLGLPLRPGGKECQYYMRTGSCKYATNCRFHHPDPTNVASREPVLEHENGDIPQQNVQGPSQPNVSIWPADQRTLNEHHAHFLAPAPSYSAGMIPPHGMIPPQGMYPTPEWSGYHQVPLSPYYPPGIPFHHFSGPPVNHQIYRGTDVPGHQQLPSDEYPERPGQPECQHFVKSGYCKFGAKCKYHHPRSLMPPPPPPPQAGTLSPLGLPLKPDQPVCTYYGRYGVCKFGPACTYNHPFNFGHPVPAAGPPLAGQYLTPGNYTV